MFALFHAFHAHKHRHIHSHSHLLTDFCLLYILQQIQAQSSLQNLFTLKNFKNITWRKKSAKAVNKK